MQQAILFDTNIDESAKIDHIAHCAFELHTGGQVFHFEYIGAQDGGGQVGSGISPRTNELLENIFQGGDAGAQFGGQIFQGYGRPAGRSGLVRVPRGRQPTPNRRVGAPFRRWRNSPGEWRNCPVGYPHPERVKIPRLVQKLSVLNPIHLQVFAIAETAVLITMLNDARSQ